MKIKLKAYIICSISIIFVIIVTTFIFNIVMVRHIDSIENTQINDDYKAVNSIIDEEYQNLHRTNLDWAHWDNTYNFISGINRQNYTEVNLQEDTLNQLDVDFMYFYDNNMNMISSLTKSTDLNAEKLMKSKIFSAQFKNNSLYFLNLNGSLYIVSEACITTTNEKAKSNGKLIIGKRFDRKMLDNINSVVKDKIEISGNNKNKIPAADTYKVVNDYVVSTRKVQDINGDKSIVYSVTMLRSYYKSARYYFGIYVMILSTVVIVTAFIAIYVFDKYVLKRLKTINSFLDAVADTQNMELRLNLCGKDEISNIAATINKMLKEIGNSREELMKLSYNDKMTGLKNRAYADMCFKKLDHKANAKYSVIMGDINGLKITNDTYGHKKGDELIKKMAEILEDSCSKGDIICRWGGDEFLILIEGKKHNYVENLIAEIKMKCEEGVKDFGFYVSMALGSANNSGMADSETVMKIAEQKMYRCKLIDVHSSRNATIKSLKKTLYEKHAETEEHTLRVKNLSLELGRKINLPRHKLEELELLSTLHDIGKIGIPEDILRKPGKLTDKEWIIMKSHTEIGYRIAKAVPELAYVADEILSHHEKYDGTGYPQGLKGEQIPVLSRVINIVDSFDVMTHRREYKEAKSVDYAVQELKRCAGTQFDPMLVEKFLELLEKQRFS